MSAPQKAYRLYCFDGARKIVTADWIEAVSDEDAIARAETACFGPKWEIWEGNRLVAQLEDDRRQA